MDKPFIRFQLADNQKYYQLILVLPKPDGSKKEIRFSKGYYDVANYVNKRNQTKFLIFDLMFKKDSPEYRAHLKNKAKNKEKEDNLTII